MLGGAAGELSRQPRGTGDPRKFDQRLDKDTARFVVLRMDGSVVVCVCVCGRVVSVLVSDGWPLTLL